MCCGCSLSRVCLTAILYSYMSRTDLVRYLAYIILMSGKGSLNIPALGLKAASLPYSRTCMESVMLYVHHMKLYNTSLFLWTEQGCVKSLLNIIESTQCALPRMLMVNLF